MIGGSIQMKPWIQQKNGRQFSLSRRSACLLTRRSSPRFCRPSPEGTSENSPAFQRWVGPARKLSPEGSAETLPHPSLRDLGPNNAIPSVETLGYFQSSLREATRNAKQLMGNKTMTRGGLNCCGRGRLRSAD
jgi:hypothetical protein